MGACCSGGAANEISWLGAFSDANSLWCSPFACAEFTAALGGRPLILGRLNVILPGDCRFGVQNEESHPQETSQGDSPFLLAATSRRQARQATAARPATNVLVSISARPARTAGRARTSRSRCTRDRQEVHALLAVSATCLTASWAIRPASTQALLWLARRCSRASPDSRAPRAEAAQTCRARRTSCSRALAPTRWVAQ